MKYNIIYHNISSVKSPYALRIELPIKPDNEEEIKKWLIDTFGKFGYIYKVVESGWVYSEIYLKNEGDATFFELKWGGTLQEPTKEQ